MLNVTTLPVPTLCSKLSPTIGIARLTLKLKIILFNRKLYTIVFILKQKYNTTKAYSCTAEPGSLSNQPCSFCEMTTSGGDVHPLLSWGRSTCCPHIQERSHFTDVG